MDTDLKAIRVKKLTEIYDKLQALPGLTASEVTFTLAPSRTPGIQEAKRSMLKWVEQRILHHKKQGLAGYILTRENHANGWAHVHGIVWFQTIKNNALMLSAGRIWSDRMVNNKKEGWLYNPLGKTEVDKLRVDKYEQIKKGDKTGTEYNGWIDYITKDQGINWREPYRYGVLISVEDYFDTTIQTDLID